MKTDALIDDLAERGAAMSAGRAARILGLGAGGGALVSFAAMVLWLGIRPDMADAMTTGAYWMKFFYTLLFAVAGFWTIERLARPGTSSRRQMILEALPFALIALLALVRLALVPAAMRMPMAMGHSSHVCPWRIAILALPVFAGTFWSLSEARTRRGPSSAGSRRGLPRVRSAPSSMPSIATRARRRSWRCGTHWASGSSASSGLFWGASLLRW